MARSVLVGLIALCVTAISGCSMPPSPGDVEAALEAEYGPLVSVQGVARTDGLAYPGNDGAPDRYAVGFTAVLLPNEDVTVKISSGLERTVDEGARIKSINPGHESVPDGLTLLPAIGTALWRANSFQPTPIHGEVLFARVDREWRKVESLAYLADSVVARGVTADVPRRNRVSAWNARGTVDERESMQRCESFATWRGLSRPTQLDGLRGRLRSVAAALPDEGLVLWGGSAGGWEVEDYPSGGPVGTIAVLPTREICVGPELVPGWPGEWLRTRPEMWTIDLSGPSPVHKWRLLVVREVDEGLWKAWVVHPDSARALTDDIIEDRRRPDGLRMNAWGANSLWSDDEGRATFWFGDITGVRAVASGAVGRGEVTRVDVRHVLPTNEACGVFPWLDESVWRWTTSDVLETRLRLELDPDWYRPHGVGDCSMPPDTAAAIAIDFAMGTVTRLR